ncbi:DUF3558 domain-containing protein [Actinosynnema mirum]|uniref:DUF3558 domain-containing protein n=1 Tax=Actinosynnema mirum (strain ATCC 29888 / DSM 43827 / JCM 3225 / NBRC 14064 / NCIMB 13271 / NRRL B-12336 / IMRU 3971 / 101) TaxID=446462 RepID=C6WKE9_ACTMD|nr:DUF3558 domain-containing protein [Actinosynnema mirum]ACU40200.1 hypothetical protein Amir_6399 [Actinosynnema mirum DSM 43827]
MKAAHMLLGALLALPVLVSCTATSPAPKADGHVDEPLSVTTTPPPSLFPRPSEMPLDGVAPCSLLDEKQRGELSLDNPENEYVETSLAGARACSLRSNVSGNVVRLALVTGEGVLLWLDDYAQVEVETIAVVGFPALVVRTPGVEDVCNVEVDVARGQFLDVMFRDGGNSTPLAQDVLCQGARRAAEAAVTGLLQRK